MTNIYIYKTYILIKGYNKDSELYKKFERYMSAWEINNITGSKYISFTAITKINEDTIKISSGIDFKLLEYYFPDAHIENCITTVNEPYNVVRTYGLLKGPRNDIQYNAIKFLKKDYLVQKYLCLQTGLGKTYCTINYCHHCKKFPLIVVDQTNLLSQWKKNIHEFTTLADSEIYVISGKASVNKLMNMNSGEISKFKFVLAYHKTLQILYNEDLLKDFFKKCMFGLKVFDEAHVYWKNILNIDMASNIETIYLSATPKLVNSNDDILYQKLFKSVSKHFDKLDYNYINVALVNYKSFCKDYEIVKFYGNRGFDSKIYSKHLINNGLEHFKNVLCDTIRMVMSNRLNRKKKIVIILKLIEQTEVAKNIIEEYLKENNSPMTVSTLTGKVKKNERDEALAQDIICTTDITFSKALHLGNLEILINFVPVNCFNGNTTRLNQITGRLEYIPDKEIFFVDMIDRSIQGLVNMSTNRVKYYKTMAKKIYKINGYGCRKES